MAARKNQNSPAGSSATPKQPARSNGDSARWICGLLLFFAGLFAVCAVFFSFFNWAADQSFLQKTAADRSLLGLEISNPCGAAGARLGQLFVDRSFGVFGILLPVMLLLAGVRIIRRRPLLFNHSILSLCFIMILGSLSLGFLLADRWSLCCSSGWGGAYGIEIAALLRQSIGALGTLILLVGGWILTGVFLNRNFIDKVNDTGNAVMNRSERIFERFRDAMTPKSPEGEAEETPDASDAPDVSDVPGETLPPAPQPAAPLRSTAPASTLSRPRTSAEEEPGLLIERPGSAEPEPEEENPFLEYGPEEVPAQEPAQAHDAAHTAAGEEGLVEVDLNHPGGRVVMGRGGLVELEPARRPVQPAVPDSDNPFVEVTADGEPVAVPAAVAATPSGQTAPRPMAGDDPFTLVPVGTEAGPAESWPQQAENGRMQEAENSPRPAVAPAEGTEGLTELPSTESQGVVVTVEERIDPVVEVQRIPTTSYDPLKELEEYRKPPVALLEDYTSDSEVSNEEIFENKSRIEETLKYFGIPIQRIKATIGPTVTLYEIVQEQGIKISRIQGLQNDIAQSLKAESGIRIIAPIPGRGTIGIEVPNRNKQVVSMYSAVRSRRFQESRAELPVVIGRTIQNENYVFDLAKMPHLLVAGATGMGKSVGLNAIITSLLYRKHPAQLKFVMIDPKMVEFSLYARIERHFLAKMESEEEAVITDPKKAVYTLNALCLEMDNRLEMCKNAGARNISEYNEKFVARRLNPQKGHRYLPYIVVVIDEFADLIMMAKEVEAPVIRLAQKARAVGIHLIVATQRPSVDVITGKIKANFPSRIAFRVVQMIDSRTIIDQPGANQLIGRGDMLFSKDGELTRIQCALVETAEVERIVDYIAGQQGYSAPYPLPDYTPEGGDSGLGSEESAAPVKYDALFAEIARDAVSSGQISTSMIQRNYEVGFNRAGRIMMQLERAGIVGRQQGAKPRDILFHDPQSLEAKLQDLGVF